MLPYPHISPEIIRVGPLAVRWYGLMYVCGFVLGFALVKARARAGLFKVNYAACESFVTYMIVSMLLGARVTYCLVYNWDYYSSNIGEIPKVWQGGLSFHGAAIGMSVGCYLFARKYKITMYSVLDSLAYCCAPGLFFGRMGNFINGELYGRPTSLPWAMIFPTDPEHLPRHPSQLYQGLSEGLLLFLILTLVQRWLIQKRHYRDGLIGSLFGMLYSIFRFIVEFAREPDKQLGFVLGPFSMGQLLCVIFFLISAAVFAHSLMTNPRLHPEPRTDADLGDDPTPAPAKKSRK